MWARRCLITPPSHTLQERPCTATTFHTHMENSSSLSSPAPEHTPKSRNTHTHTITHLLIRHIKHLTHTVNALCHFPVSHIDVGGALAMVGVVDVITAKDVPGRRSVSFTGMDEELLAENKVLNFTFYLRSSYIHQ